MIITLYNSGIGEFETDFDVDQKELFFLIPKKNIKEVSFRVLGDVEIISHPNYNLGEPIKLESSDLRSSLFTTIIGSEIQIKHFNKIVKGKILGIDYMEKEAGSFVARHPYLTILKDNECISVSLQDLECFTICDEGIKTRLSNSKSVEVSMKLKAKGKSSVIYSMPVPPWIPEYELFVNKKSKIVVKCVVTNDTEKSWEDCKLNLISDDSQFKINKITISSNTVNLITVCELDVVSKLVNYYSDSENCKAILLQIDANLPQGKCKINLNNKIIKTEIPNLNAKERYVLRCENSNVCVDSNELSNRNLIGLNVSNGKAIAKFNNCFIIEYGVKNNDLDFCFDYYRKSTDSKIECKSLFEDDFVEFKRFVVRSNSFIVKETWNNVEEIYLTDLKWLEENALKTIKIQNIEGAIEAKVDLENVLSKKQSIEDNIHSLNVMLNNAKESLQIVSEDDKDNYNYWIGRLGDCERKLIIFREDFKKVSEDLISAQTRFNASLNVLSCKWGEIEENKENN